MSEHDANKALTATARLRTLTLENDPLEQTQVMPVADRRYRQREGRHMHEEARGLGHARAMLNNPVYRNQEIAAGLREPPRATAGEWSQEQIDAHVDRLAADAGWPVALKPGATSVYGRLPDFRDGDSFERGEAGHHARMQRDGFKDE